jgi:hypothetical protein
MITQTLGEIFDIFKRPEKMRFANRWRGGVVEQYHPDCNREAAQGDEIAREPTARAFPLRLEML